MFLKDGFSSKLLERIAGRKAKWTFRIRDGVDFEFGDLSFTYVDNDPYIDTFRSLSHEIRHER